MPPCHANRYERSQPGCNLWEDPCPTRLVSVKPMQRKHLTVEMGFRKHRPQVYVVSSVEHMLGYSLHSEKAPGISNEQHPSTEMETSPMVYSPGCQYPRVQRLFVVPPETAYYALKVEACAKASVVKHSAASQATAGGRVKCCLFHAPNQCSKLRLLHPLYGFILQLCNIWRDDNG